MESVRAECVFCNAVGKSNLLKAPRLEATNFLNCACLPTSANSKGFSYLIRVRQWQTKLQNKCNTKTTKFKVWQGGVVQIPIVHTHLCNFGSKRHHRLHCQLCCCAQHQHHMRAHVCICRELRNVPSRAGQCKSGVKADAEGPIMIHALVCARGNNGGGGARLGGAT